MTGKQLRIQVSVSDVRQSAEVEFLPASGVTGTMTLSADNLLSLVIKALGQVRQMMMEGAEMPSLEGQEVEAVFNTRWYVQPEMIGEASALTFQHPAFGMMTLQM